MKWFDYWLKGIKSDVIDEPAVRYFMMGDPRPACARQRVAHGRGLAAEIGRDKLLPARQWPAGDDRAIGRRRDGYARLGSQESRPHGGRQ